MSRRRRRISLIERDRRVDEVVAARLLVDDVKDNGDAIHIARSEEESNAHMRAMMDALEAAHERIGELLRTEDT